MPRGTAGTSDVLEVGDAFCCRCKEKRLGQVRVRRRGRVTFHPGGLDVPTIEKCQSCGTRQTIEVVQDGKRAD